MIINKTIHPIVRFKSQLEPIQQSLQSHSLYQSIKTTRQLRIFMQNHVWAVWDFMSLVKRMQHHFTTLTLPWVPPQNRSSAYFLNQIILCEESDDMGTGDYTSSSSHYELYLNAMREVNAVTQPIESFVADISKGLPWQKALDKSQKENKGLIHQNTYDFVRNTLDSVQNASIVSVSSQFLYGREDPIPHMFQQILDNMRNEQLRVPNLEVYLQRHIQVDGDDHGPMAENLMIDLCKSPTDYDEAFQAASLAISQRIRLWDGVKEMI